MRRIKLGIAAATASVVGVVGLGVATAAPAHAARGQLVHICLTIRPNPPICIDI